MVNFRIPSVKIPERNTLKNQLAPLHRIKYPDNAKEKERLSKIPENYKKG